MNITTKKLELLLNGDKVYYNVNCGLCKHLRVNVLPHEQTCDLSGLSFSSENAYMKCGYCNEFKLNNTRRIKLI